MDKIRKLHTILLHPAQADYIDIDELLFILLRQHSLVLYISHFRLTDELRNFILVYKGSMVPERFKIPIVFTPGERRNLPGCLSLEEGSVEDIL